MSAAWIMSAKADICVSPNIDLSNEKRTLGGRRARSERADDLHRKRPRRELLAVVRPEAEHVRGELVDVVVVVSRAGALGQVGRQLALQAGDMLGQRRDGGEPVDPRGREVLRRKRRVERLDEAVDLEQLRAVIVGLAVAGQAVTQVADAVLHLLRKPLPLGERAHIDRRLRLVRLEEVLGPLVL